MVWNLVGNGLEFGCEWYENLVRNGLGIRLEMVWE